MLTPRHAMPSTPRTPLQKERAPFAEDLPSSWDATCDWVLATRVSLWDSLFEQIFLQVSILSSTYLTQKGMQRMWLAVSQETFRCPTEFLPDLSSSP